MALLILALLQRIFLMSSLMLLLVWLIFFMVLIKLLPILGTISGKSVDRKSGSAGMPRPISYAVFCLKKKKETNRRQEHRVVGDVKVAELVLSPEFIDHTRGSCVDYTRRAADAR